MEALYNNLQNPVHAIGFGIAITITAIGVSSALVDMWYKYKYKDEA